MPQGAAHSRKLKRRSSPAQNRPPKGGRVHALTITDNAGGNPSISAELLGIEVNNLGIEPLVHFACKDKNRNQIEGLLHGLERASVRNLLVLTGDYNYSGYRGPAQPVFDMDASQLLEFITALNQGLEVPTFRGTTTLAPTHFVAGAVVSPFKATEAELMGQYYKLQKKLTSGAQFIVTQLGYDARKFHEVILQMKRLGFEHVPVVGNVYVLGRGPARLMNRNGLPGCVVTDELMSLLEDESKESDKGKAKRLDRAAKMVAFMKGMGFAGAHIGGHGLKYEDVLYIIDRGEELAANWHDVLPEFDFPQPNGWYYFEQGSRDRPEYRHARRSVQGQTARATGLSWFSPVAQHGVRKRGSAPQTDGRPFPGYRGNKIRARLYAVGAHWQRDQQRVHALWRLRARRRRVHVPDESMPQGAAQWALRGQL